MKRIAIIGAGFSGTLLAINLLRHDGPRAILIERAGQAAKGVAYGAAHPSHVLNVRAGNMSAFPDDPDHFVRWLAAHGDGDSDTFVRRVVYGRYLAELLDEARRSAAGRLDLVAGDVVDVRLGDRDVALHLADGRRIEADAAVLAVGNLPPHDPPGLGSASLSPLRYQADPWQTTDTGPLEQGDTVLAIGSGLTMVDVALRLDAEGFGGRIVALSRRGLLPRRHAPSVAATSPRLRERPGTVATALLRQVRSRGEATGWRAAVDELRPFTQPMWANAGEAERHRFLRHLRPWWDVHRHRLAPAVADRLAAMQAAGRLKVVAGRTVAFRETDAGVDVTWRPRGDDRPQRMTVQRIVNCTGPQGDLLRTTDPLLAALVASGMVRPDQARLGIDVDAGSATIAADGSVNDRLLALGPMTRGAFWEIVAVPDIRMQSWTLARRLSNAHWVGGEGL